MIRENEPELAIQLNFTGDNAEKISNAEKVIDVKISKDLTR